ncbi:zinc-ribbon domain-containing protein [Sphingomonas sp.]|uniref:zinc-ribbon domain-containing protein n=1 Tax=Sphingomonas sp. TaxID=28214 RepID=UPI00286E4831|nr:zinc-ribbon domain-containing protein [Sphingomonas sp.]
MILTCPACSTQYVVKDGAIPPGGRQVRCASCRHGWHQDPEASADDADPPAGDPLGEPLEEAVAEATDDYAGTGAEAETGAETETGAEAPGEITRDLGQAAYGAPPGYAPVDTAADRPPEPEWRAEAEPPGEPASETPTPWNEPAPVADDIHLTEPAADPEPPSAWDEPAPLDDDFSPFRQREPAEPRGGLAVKLLVALVIVGALAVAFWFFAPAEWRQRFGLASLTDTPLQVRITHSDRQTLASGNELLAISGRVTNPTGEQQAVPPIYAQLRSSTGVLVYSWTIAPPARRLQPGASATFNSAEVNVPAGADELTVTLGAPRG